MLFLLLTDCLCVGGSREHSDSEQRFLLLFFSERTKKTRRESKSGCRNKSVTFVSHKLINQSLPLIQEQKLNSAEIMKCFVLTTVEENQPLLQKQVGNMLM